MSPVNGLRPSPLRISKDSHGIQKSSNSNSLHQHQNQVAMANKQQQHRQPVIIYTHSPQTIHTNPRDFMAVVQKLTGRSTSAPPTTTTTTTSNQTNNYKTQGDGGGRRDRSEQHNRDLDEKFEGLGLMAEIPLFTPNSSNLFFSPPKASLQRNPDDDQCSPGIAGSLSPSFMEFLNMKELP